MSGINRKPPAPPTFADEFDLVGSITHTLPILRHQPHGLPWVPHAEPHRQKADESIFAAFLAVDQPKERVWVVRGLLANTVSGPVVIRQLTVDAFDVYANPIEIAAADLRELRIGAIRDRALATLVSLGQVAGAEYGARMFPSPKARAAATATADRVVEAKSEGGRPALTDEHHEKVARLYIELFRSGTRRGILDELGKQLGKRGRPVPRETVRDWVYRAREAGFLAPTKQGRAYGAPGPRLVEIDKRTTNDV